MKYVVAELLKKIEEIIYPSWQEHYDNAGFQIGNPTDELTGVVVSLDVTFDVLNFAVQEGANLIISHHPMFFHPLKNILLDNERGKLVAYCIENKLNIYSIHTNLDKSALGINYSIAEELGLKNIETLAPEKGYLKKLVTFCPHEFADKVRDAIFQAGAGVIGNYDSCSYNVEGYGTFKGNEQTNPFVGEKGKLHKEPETRIETIFPAEKEAKVIEALLTSHPYEEVAYDIYSLDNIWPQVGLGAVGYLFQPMPLDVFLQEVKRIFEVPFVKYSKGFQTEIKRVAVCGGTGISLLSRAVASGADVFITSDIKYHDFQQAYGKIHLIDVGHYEMEMLGMKKIYEYIFKLLHNFAKVKLYRNQNIVQYC
jgi:dinuclear metal center YbgI/SA1388 family protein